MERPTKQATTTDRPLAGIPDELGALYGVPVTERLLQRTAHTVSGRFLEFYGRPFEPSSCQGRILVARDTLKYWCGEVFFDHSLKAVTRLNRRPALKERLFGAVERDLTPGGHPEDPGAYLDPLCWSPMDVELPWTMRMLRSARAKALLVVAVFVEGMLDQEAGLRRAKVSIEYAGEVAEREREEHGLLQYEMKPAQVVEPAVGRELSVSASRPRFVRRIKEVAAEEPQVPFAV